MPAALTTAAVGGALYVIVYGPVRRSILGGRIPKRMIDWFLQTGAALVQQRMPNGLRRSSKDVHLRRRKDSGLTQADSPEQSPCGHIDP